MIKKLLFTITAAFALSAGAAAALAADVTVGNGGSFADFTELVSGIESGSIVLNEDDTIKLSSDVTMTSSLTIPNGYDLNFDMNGKKITAVGFTGRPFIISSGSSLAVYGNGEIDSDSYGAFDVYGGLTIKDGYYHAIGYTGDAGGAVLRTRPGSSLTIGDDVRVFSQTTGAVYSEGFLKAGKCTLTSHSHNGLQTPNGVNLWSYCVQSVGEAEFNGTNIQGVQGGLYIGGTGTINGGTYTAAELTDGSYTGARAFYGLYISNDASVTINDGTFNAGSYKYCVLNSDNDVGMAPSDKIIINGGIFNGVVGTKIGADLSVDAFTINGGKFSDIMNGSILLSECVPDGYKFVYRDGYYSLEPTVKEDMGSAMPFRTTVSEDTAGHYFDFEKTGLSAISKANIILSSESEQKTIEKTIDIPTITTDGSVSFSVLVLNAPADVTGTIELK